MDTYTICFFGHRVINRHIDAAERLENIIEKFVKSKEYVELLVGREGDFDILVSSVICRITKKYNYGNTAHVLVLPYMRTEYRDNEEGFLKYYDEVEICEKSCKAHYKSAIQIRNRDMVDRSELVVCYVENQQGGAYTTMQYALKQCKKVINVADELYDKLI